MSFKDWEKAEAIVAKAIGGRRTPGSGNQYILGDVRAPGKVVEVKQTKNPAITIDSDWLDELLALSKRDEVALAIFFELRCHVYFYETDVDEEDIWRTKLVKENEMPETIVYKDTLWRLGNIEDLKNW